MHLIQCRRDKGHKAEDGDSECEGKGSCESLGSRQRHAGVTSFFILPESWQTVPSRTGSSEGIEPCALNLTCAPDMALNEDTWHTHWILIVPLHFLQSVTVLVAYSTSDRQTVVKVQHWGKLKSPYVFLTCAIWDKTIQYGRGAAGFTQTHQARQIDLC